jgi:hypothetical protein
MDEYGEGLYPDLLFYYNVDFCDVIAGRGPAPLLVLSLVQRLPDDSLTSALANGGREHFGWGNDRHLLADTYDAINLNTKATGNWKPGKQPALPPWPRPGRDEKTAKKKPVSVADIYARFSRR